MTEGMLMELDTRSCWTLGEALGHQQQHFLSRGVWDHDLARDRLMTWMAGELANDQAVLIVDETGDEKSSTDCVGAARQYSRALGGIGLCHRPESPPVAWTRARPPAGTPGCAGA
jgi:SRSO17 transposase